VISISIPSRPEVRLHVGGCTVGFARGGIEWEEPIGDFAARCSTEEPGPYVGTICWGCDPGPPSPGPPDLTAETIRAWTRQEAPRFELATAEIVLPSIDRVVVQARTGSAGRAFRQALPLALGWLLSRADHWVIHGAAIAPAPGDNAVLVIGPTGTGKSTTAAAAIQARWSVLADDCVVVRLGPQYAEVRGIPRPLALPPGLNGPDARGQPIQGDLRGRWAVEVPLATGWHPVGSLVILAHGTEAETHIERAAGIDALRALWASHFPAAVASRLKLWFPRAGSLARLPAWRMHLGADQATRLDTISRCLQEVIAKAPTSTPP
jgi:hypothetical protein